MAYKMWDVDKIKEAIRKKQSTIDKNSRKMKTAPKSISIGWDQSSGTYPEQDGKPVWYIAKIHDEGLGPHSEKKMIETTIFLNRTKWAKLYSKLQGQALKKNKIPDYYQIAETIGETMKQDLEDYVYQIDLVETERLANSIITRYHRR